MLPSWSSVASSAGGMSDKGSLRFAKCMIMDLPGTDSE